MVFKDMKLELIADIVEMKNEMYLEALYRLVVKFDRSWLDELFYTEEDYRDFIKKEYKDIIEYEERTKGDK